MRIVGSGEEHGGGGGKKSKVMFGKHDCQTNIVCYSYAPANVTPKIKIHIEILSHAVCQ